MIAAQAVNPVLTGMIEALVSRTVLERLWRSVSEVGVDQRTHQEHVGIWRALDARDTEIARFRMAYHLFGEEEALDSD